MDMSNQLTQMLILFVPVGLVFYFLVFRPQQQQAKQHRQAIENLRRGDIVVTSGGIVGRIVKATAKEEPEITVEIADGVQIKVVKSTLSEVRAKTQPVDAKSEKN